MGAEIETDVLKSVHLVGEPGGRCTVVEAWAPCAQVVTAEHHCPDHGPRC